MDESILPSDFGMPLLEGDDFFKDLDGMEQDFALEAEIQDYDGELELGSEEDDEETYIESPDYPETPDEKITRQEQLRMMHLRSHLNQLTEKVKHHQYLTQKTREELKQCRNRIDELEKEGDDTKKEVQSNESTGNTSALYRLRAQLERIFQELSDERAIEKLIRERLEKEEYELAKVDVQRGKFLLAEDELQKKEQQVSKEKTELAMKRLKKEEKKALQAEKNLRTRHRLYMEALKDQERKHQFRVDEAQKSKENHKRFVNDTMSKMRRREVEEDQRYKENMQKKMDMLLKLKKDITANRENLKALRARDKAAEKDQKQREQDVRQKIIDEGGNPEEILLIQKRLEDLERQKSAFEMNQKEKQSKIMEKVLLEEERMKKRKKQQPNLWEDPKREKSKIVSPMKKKPLKIFQEYTKMSGMETDTSFDLTNSLDVKVSRDAEKKTDKEPEAPDGRESVGDALTTEPPPTIPDSSDSSDNEDQEGLVPDLAKPEFEGLWDQHKPYKVPKDVATSPLKIPGASKMDKEILSKVLDKHRAGIVVKQVAAGKEFSGCPFYSKPDVIHFKDFDVGKTYKKKVTLTNVSYTVNYCKYLDITERLKDFIEIHFDPPGQMSAGLTCEMLVTFKPMINEDLDGEVKFLSQTGPFSIPLKCTTKKCDLSVDTDVIQFGTTVIGETMKRTFTLTNKGALGTRFDFFKVTGMKGRTVTTAETSLGRLTAGVESSQAVSPVTTDQDKQKKDTTAVTAEASEVKKSGEDVTKVGDEVQAAGTTSEGQPQTAEGEQGAPAPADVQEEGQEGAVGGLEGSPDLLESEADDYGTIDGMKVGVIASGDINAFSSTKLEIIWQPTIPGRVDSEFLVTFSDPLSESISIRSMAHAIDVPVWVERQNVDLKICMFDRLYQDTIVVNNRATTALRLKFEVCKELRNHLELLPKTGYIQAQSQFSAQLKFLPRHSLFEEAGKYFDKETGVLEAPMTIRVADQTAPVPFTVQAVVTNSDMEFDVSEIDFGCCTIYESTKTTIKLTNKSILPQEFGFVGHPEYVEVQPNDGFGTLLPLETIELDVIFSPARARDYKFELNCKSLINREFKIQCKGVGVHPPLELTHQKIHFGATSLYDVSTAAFHVVNSHTSMNEFTHPVPRIGKGEIAPVSPTSFEFVVPKDSPITVSPSVGTIKPGEKCRIQVRFAPELDDDVVRKEAVRMATKQLEAQAEKEHKEALKRQKEAEEIAQKAKDNKKGAAGGANKGPPKGKQTPAGATLTVTGPRPLSPPTPESITKDSAAYAAAVGSLLRQFKGKFQNFVIPCYVASGPCSNPGELLYSIHNTLYLEVNCPTVKPPLVVISDHGKTTTDFGEVSLGQNIFKSITIQNISKKTLEISSTPLDTAGPFLVMNAFRMLAPNATHTMLVSFTPDAGRVFREVLSIKCEMASLHLILQGKGVSPLVNLSTAVESGIMDMGAVLAGEYVEKPFKMENTSSLSIDYLIRLESMSLLRHAHAQELPEFVQKPGTKPKSQVGVQNNNGQNVFDLVPAEGTIDPGGSIEVLVTFAPDHCSDFFSDGVKIELFGKKESHAFKLVGKAKSHIMFVEGTDPLTPDLESLAVKPPVQLDEEEAKQHYTPVLFTLKSIAKENEYVPGTRDLLIGCVRTMAVSQKKEPPRPGYRNGEYQFENPQVVQQKGFTIDPQKGMVEAGVLKPVTITWTPPAGHDPNQPMEASIMLTLKGDVTEQVRVMLRAMVVSE